MNCYENHFVNKVLFLLSLLLIVKFTHQKPYSYSALLRVSRTARIRLYAVVLLGTRMVINTVRPADLYQTTS